MLGAHPDQQAVSKGGRVVHFGEGGRASTHDLPAHVEHSGTSAGEQRHSEEQGPVPEHAGTLKAQHMGPDAVPQLLRVQLSQAPTQGSSAPATQDTLPSGAGSHKKKKIQRHAVKQHFEYFSNVRLERANTHL